MDRAHLKDWVPCRVLWRENHPQVEWCCLNERFSEPFFAQTIERCLDLPVNQSPRPETPLEMLGDLCAQHSGLRPSGFIFHMSRCGSTLLAQMLAALPQNVVLSEAEPLDAVLSAHLQVSGLRRETQVAWLRWMVSALGQVRHPDERHLFFKMDSWHTLYLPLVLEAFPDVPWIFLYRDPVEVMVSHRRHPGTQMVPGSRSRGLLGLDAIEACLMAPEEYCARVLAAICQPVIDAYTSNQCLLINYSELPEAGWQDLPQHLGITYSDSDRAAMRRMAGFDAKHPAQRFQDDRGNKQREVTPAQRHQAELWINPLYQRLEQLRGR